MTDDRGRFEDIFTENYAALIRYAARRVGHDAAQEIVAETFMVAWRRLTEVPAYPPPWLYSTARRVVANELRRRARAARTGERVEAEGATVSPDHAEAVTERIRIDRALHTLSETDREVLLLTQWEQISTAHAAEVLGCMVTAIKVRLHRARKRFASALADVDDPARVGLAIVTRGETA